MKTSSSYQAPVTFQDVAACFTEEEWKLLHQWQKELYRNVMNEIHQALISLGPLIATSVFSLKAKENEDLCHGEEDYERRTGEKTDSCEQMFGINREENQFPKDYQETDERMTNDSLSTAFPVLNFDNVFRMEHELESNLMAHQNVYGTESSTHPTSEPETDLPIISFRIKEEEETYSVDRQGSERAGHINVPKSSFPSLSIEPEASLINYIDAEGAESSISLGTDYEAIKRKRRAINSKKRNDTPTCSASSGKANAKVLQQFQKGTSSGSQLSAEINPELRGEETAQYGIDFKKEMYSNLERSYANNECGNNMRKVNLEISSQTTHQNWRPCIVSEYEQNVTFKEGLVKHTMSGTKGRRYICSECGKGFTQMGNLLRHQTIHIGQKPYKCTECEKSFSQKVHFIRHQRTHSGERPYQCTECKKSFSRKESLLAHQRTHTGDKPYQCSECEKSYSVKQSLIFHHRKHSGEKPYQCSLCDKRFSWKQNLVGHQRTHMAAQFKGTDHDGY